MVAMSEEQKRRYWLDLQEDYAEFKVSHRQEAKSKFTFVDARLITLPGLVLYDLERKRFIESNGSHGYRPLQ